jgi:aryl-alcohol dehydrogenase-like predicted oxidoreductase
MKIALGTANFGSQYGILKNKSLSIATVGKLLSFAKKKNILTIDTAVNYIGSEKILGNFDLSDFKIITKLPNPPKNFKNIENWINKEIEGSLKRLRIKKLYAVLIHDSNLFVNPNIDSIMKSLKKLQDKKLVQKIGISIYDLKILKKILKKYRCIKIVQVPLNLFNRQLITSGWIKKLNNMNIEVHIRSIFLQGLLLVDRKLIPKFFKSWMNKFKDLENWHIKRKLDILTTCIKFVSNNNLIHKIVIGVENLDQLKQIYKIFNDKKRQVIPRIFSKDKKLIYPYNWKL